MSYRFRRTTGVTLPPPRSLGSDSYITPDGGIVDFASSTTALSNGNRTLTVAVAGTCQNTGCAGIGQSVSAATFSFAPATTLTDPTGSPAVGSRTDVLRIF